MTIDEALRARLISFPGLAALVVARVYPLLMPQGETRPGVTFQRISGRRIQSLGGPSGLANPRYQIDAWATTGDVARAVGTQVRLALDGFSDLSIGAALIIGDRDDYDRDAKLFRFSADYSVWHEEETAA